MVIKLFPCSTQLSTKFILLINIKMPIIVGILTFISMINTISERLNAETSSFVGILVFILVFEFFKFRAQMSLALKSLITLRPELLIHHENRAEHEILPAYKCQNANNCWHFNIY